MGRKSWSAEGVEHWSRRNLSFNAVPPSTQRPLDEFSPPRPTSALVALRTAVRGHGDELLDRQVLSVLAPVITEQLEMTNTEYSYVTTAFLVSYSVMFLLGGRMMDVLGTRLGMALSVGFWSVASAAHAVVQNAFHLGACRFLLGAGEGGCFPGAAKGVAEWFPAATGDGDGDRHRRIGPSAVVAPPLTVWLALAAGEACSLRPD